MGFKLENTAQIAKKKSNKTDLSSLLQKEVLVLDKLFSNKKKEEFYTELSVLLNAGITLKEALDLIKESRAKEKHKKYFQELIDKLVSGSSFSNAIKTKKEFTEYEYHSVKIGEETGTLPKISEELGKFFARKNQQRRNVVNALTYPMIILITAILVVIFMLRMVVPMFQDIFRQNKVELPAITKMIICISDIIKDYGVWFLLFCFVLFLFRKVLARKESFKRIRDRFLLRMPFVGKFIKAVYLAQFTQAISLLTSSRIPMLNSISLIGKMIDFYPLTEALLKVEKRIINGNSLSESLGKNKVFDSRMIAMVKVAEETNKTEFIFEKLNEQYNIEVEQKSKVLTTFLEPIIIIVVGVLVGIILVAMYLPMFKLGSVLGG